MVFDTLSIQHLHYLLIFYVYEIFGVCVLFNICFYYQMITYCQTNTNVFTEEQQILCFSTEGFFKNVSNWNTLEQRHWMNHIAKSCSSYSVIHYHLPTTLQQVYFILILRMSTGYICKNFFCDQDFSCDHPINVRKNNN